jgi:hypothetical protein
MTELQQLRAMLCRTGIGHGERFDYNPPGTAVQIETGEDEQQFVVVEFGFDAEGRLATVTTYPGEAG